ncbi:MAG: hypothetical protein ABIZ49_07725, partial [Opitutaceae bacterium]
IAAHKVDATVTKHRWSWLTFPFGHSFHGGPSRVVPVPNPSPNEIARRFPISFGLASVAMAFRRALSSNT